MLTLLVLPWMVEWREGTSYTALFILIHALFTQNSLFIFRVRPGYEDETPVLAIQRVFPIDDELNIQMAQAKPGPQMALGSLSKTGSCRRFTPHSSWFNS
jgi:hypothetical protein